MFVLQECLDKFSKKLSIILEAQGVSLSVCLFVTFDLLSLHHNLHSWHDAYQLQYAAAWSNKAAAATALSTLDLTFHSLLSLFQSQDVIETTQKAVKTKLQTFVKEWVSYFGGLPLFVSCNLFLFLVPLSQALV